MTGEASRFFAERKQQANGDGHACCECVATDCDCMNGDEYDACVSCQACQDERAIAAGTDAAWPEIPRNLEGL